jgi:hypothetical protein
VFFDRQRHIEMVNALRMRDLGDFGNLAQEREPRYPRWSPPARSSMKPMTW